MREVCDPLLPWLCENSDIRADILMMMFEKYNNQSTKWRGKTWDLVIMDDIR